MSLPRTLAPCARCAQLSSGARSCSHPLTLQRPRHRLRSQCDWDLPAPGHATPSSEKFMNSAGTWWRPMPHFSCRALSVNRRVTPGQEPPNPVTARASVDLSPTGPSTLWSTMPSSQSVCGSWSIFSMGSNCQGHGGVKSVNKRTGVASHRPVHGVRSGAGLPGLTSGALILVPGQRSGPISDKLFVTAATPGPGCLRWRSRLGASLQASSSTQCAPSQTTKKASKLMLRHVSNQVRPWLITAKPNGSTRFGRRQPSSFPKVEFQQGRLDQ